MIKIRNWGVLSWMTWCFQVAPVVKTPPANTGDPGSIPGSGRRPGARGGYPVQYSCLGNLTDGEAWRAPVPGGHKESVTTECGTQRPPSNLPDLHQPRALDVGGPSISTEALLQGLRGQRQRRGEFRVTRRLPVGPGVPQAQESRPV